MPDDATPNDTTPTGRIPAPLLLTPGPLSTSEATRAAMARDWGSRDPEFTVLTTRVRARLLALSGAAATHVAVPLQGSGTFLVEAALGTLVPADGKVLVLVNGAYGERAAAILQTIGRRHAALRWAEDEPVDAGALSHALEQDRAIGHVVAVSCETTTGILNPIAEIAAMTARHGRRLVIDAMSSFGAIPFDGRSVPFDALVASSNKCLEGVPGLGFAIVRRTAIEAAKGKSRSLSLDLHDQWQGFERTGQWRFTPPTHVLAALDAALDQLDAEGGVEGRHRRYAENCRTLIAGMAALGFQPLLRADRQAPIIVTFRMPADRRFAFAAFYDRLARRGFVIYPGKLTMAETFRIGCIGAIQPAQVAMAVTAVGAVMADMGVKSGAPA